MQSGLHCLFSVIDYKFCMQEWPDPFSSCEEAAISNAANASYTLYVHVNRTYLYYVYVQTVFLFCQILSPSYQGHLTRA